MEDVEPRVMVGHRLLLAAVAVMMALGFSMKNINNNRCLGRW